MSAPNAISDRLYLGAEDVDLSTFEKFLCSVVANRFTGFTYWEATGAWRSEAGLDYRERTWVLAIVHNGDAVHDARIREIATAYKSRFSQLAVLRERSTIQADFL